MFSISLIVDKMKELDFGIIHRLVLKVNRVELQ